MVIHLGASPLTFRNTNGGHDLSFMDDVIYPPVSNQYNCATRKASWSCTSYNVFKFPLTMTLHSTASPSNNANTAAFGPTAYAGSTGGWLKLRSREAPGLQSDLGLPACTHDCLSILRAEFRILFNILHVSCHSLLRWPNWLLAHGASYISGVQ